MVKRETDFPLIRYEIAEADFPEETFCVVILVSLKQRWLRSQDYFVTPTEGERDSIRALLQSKVDLMESKERESALRSATHYEPPPHFPIPNDRENAREWREYEQRQKEAGTRYHQSIVEQQAQTSTLEKQVQQLTANIRTLPCIAAILQSPVPLLLSSDASCPKRYVLYKRTLWFSRKKLQPPEWRLLIENLLGAEAVKVGHALNSASPLCSRQTIPAPVRVAVWRRDQGRCTRCGNRDRLEYDHIIPVSLGGSNTERNIELLCEACNRAKSDSVALG